MNPEISKLFDKEDGVWGCVNLVSQINLKDVFAIPVVMNALEAFSLRTAMVKLFNYESTQDQAFFVDRDLRHEKIIGILNQLLDCLRSQASELGLRKV